MGAKSNDYQMFMMDLYCLQIETNVPRIRGFVTQCRSAKILLEVIDVQKENNVLLVSHEMQSL